MASSPSLPAIQLIDAVLDPGSFLSWDDPIDYEARPDDYRLASQRAAERSGVDEAVLTGAGTVDGQPVAVVVGEFGFLAGSIGVDAAARIVAAVERATRERLPLFVSPASGGTRMQEGTPAFLRMVDIARAVMNHRAAGLLYVVYLRHPTAGGVLASWGSLGQVTLAQPGALIGFLGPRVYELLEGEPFPTGVQTAENLVRVGVLDATVAPDDVAGVVATLLDVALTPPATPAAVEAPAVESRGFSWHQVEATRGAQRPGLRELLGRCESLFLLSGTTEGERDETVVVGLARLAGQSCVLIGQDRAAQAGQRLGPAALRQARRGMRLAEELRLPVVTVVDTPGGELSRQAEEGALAGEIGRCIAALTSLTVPTVSVLLGQGCGGAALALFPARHVVAAEDAWLSPLPPEGASAIVFDDVDHAAEMAARQQIDAQALHRAGFVTTLVPSPGQMGDADFIDGVVAAVAHSLADPSRSI